MDKGARANWRRTPRVVMRAMRLKDALGTRSVLGDNVGDQLAMQRPALRLIPDNDLALRSARRPELSIHRCHDRGPNQRSGALLTV
jgi:hypothetical protein